MIGSATNAAKANEIDVERELTDYRDELVELITGGAEELNIRHVEAKLREILSLPYCEDPDFTLPMDDTNLTNDENKRAWEESHY